MGIRLVENSRAWGGPSKFLSLGPQTGGVPRSRRGLTPGPHLEGVRKGPGDSSRGVTALWLVCLSSPLQPGEEMEACEELALALSRGLQLDTQRSSRDSLQCSSGYSTQTTTPCCSEDTIPSQGTRQLGFPGRTREEKGGPPRADAEGGSPANHLHRGRPGRAGLPGRATTTVPGCCSAFPPAGCRVVLNGDC